MANRKIQINYFIKGTVMFYGAILMITVLPYIIRHYFKNPCETYIFPVVEIFMLMMCGIFYVFCPRYYKHQWIVLVSGFCLYFLFKYFFKI